MSYLCELENKYRILKKLLNKGITVRCLVLGNSMAPLIRSNDVVEVAPLNRVRVGDIVIFGYAPIVLHRVVGRTEDGFLIIKGDLTQRLDLPVREEMVLGKVVAIDKSEKRIRLDGLAWRIMNFLLAKTSILLCRIPKDNKMGILVRKLLILPFILIGKLYA